MWKDLLNRWREQDLVSQMAESFDQMLEHTCWMFDHASAALLGTQSVQDVRGPLYARDKVVNRLEGRIRELIARHLRMDPSLGLGVSLALVAMTKDAERIGDYSKNLFEVAENVSGELRDTALFGRLEPIRQGVREHFDFVREALRNSDFELAERVRDEKRALQARCDAIITVVLRGETDVAAALAVAAALLARYYKRVEAHLGNIVEILVTPVGAGGLRSAEDAAAEQTARSDVPATPVAKEE